MTDSPRMVTDRSKAILVEIRESLKCSTIYGAIAALVLYIYCELVKVVAVQQGFCPSPGSGVVPVEPEWLMFAPQYGYYALFPIVMAVLSFRFSFAQKAISTALLSCGFFSLIFVAIIQIQLKSPISLWLPSHMDVLLAQLHSPYVAILKQGVICGVIISLLYMVRKISAVGPKEALRLAFCVWFLALVALIIYFLLRL